MLKKGFWKTYEFILKEVLVVILAVMLYQEVDYEYNWGLAEIAIFVGALYTGGIIARKFIKN